MTAEVSAGSHTVEVRRGPVARQLALTLKPGAEASYYLDLNTSEDVGHLQITTEPLRARVSVDGEPRGIAPLSLTNLPVGTHIVRLEAEGSAALDRRVVIRPRETTSLVVTMSGGTQPAFGWVSIASPIVLQVFEAGQLLGTTETERIVMATGRHQIELANRPLGYQESRAIQVPAGAGASLKVELPSGSVNLNALPWAEVWIDNQRVGDTPIGNHRLTIGSHRVLFRHPQLGDRSEEFTVTLTKPARVAVDFRR
jgi:hypothetical protein